MDDIIITGGTVVDATREEKAEIEIKNGKIESTSESPTEFDVEIDAGGKYVTPGIIDSHVHLNSDGRPNPPWGEEGEALLSYRAAKNLESLIHAGITTVRDLGTVGRVALDARQATREGILDGPRVLAAGNNLVMTGGHGHYASGYEIDGEVGAKKGVRYQLKRGADVIKCMATGGISSKNADVNAIELDEVELETIVATASDANVPTAAHAHGLDGIRNAVQAGITSIEHGTYMDEDVAMEMADRGTFWVPTALTRYSTLQNKDDERLPDYIIERTEDVGDELQKSFDYALKHGVKIAMGTDAGTAFNYHGKNAKEIELMVSYGLSNQEALEAATVNAAELLGLEEVGLIKSGYTADLLIMDENPLDDPAAWQNPEYVLKAGEIVVGDD